MSSSSSSSSSSSTPTVVKDLKPGEIISQTIYARFKRVDDTGRVHVERIGGTDFHMDEALAVEYTSASQFDETRKVTRTEMLRVLARTGEACFTVVFEKKMDAKTAAEKLVALDGDFRAWKRPRLQKFAQDLAKGELRTMRARMKKEMHDEHGYFQVVDLDVNEGRLVNPQTVTELIFERVKYTL